MSCCKTQSLHHSLLWLQQQQQQSCRDSSPPPNSTEKNTNGVEGGSNEDGDGDGVASSSLLTPPENFGIVEEGVYRSGYPSDENFAFLRYLNLRSIVYLCPEPYPDGFSKFLQNIGTKLFQFGIEGTKETSANIPADVICQALRVVLDKRNRPLLIHCRKGKHRTGCLVGCLRKCADVSLPWILDEYMRYADTKARETDLRFIEHFDTSSLAISPPPFPNTTDVLADKGHANDGSNRRLRRSSSVSSTTKQNMFLGPLSSAISNPIPIPNHNSNAIPSSCLVPLWCSTPHESFPRGEGEMSAPLSRANSIPNHDLSSCLVRLSSSTPHESSPREGD